MHNRLSAALFRHGCIYEEKENRLGRFLAPSLKDSDCVNHGFSTRKGGFSTPPFDSLNLSHTRPDSKAVVFANFKLFCNTFGFDFDSLAIINYEHGTTVLEVTQKERGRGFEKPVLPFCDGLVTNDPNVTLVTSHADCGALFLLDPVKRAIGLAHAGWKGTFGRIGAQVVERLNTLYGSRPEDIIAAAGPCICRDCFEVDIELAQRFADKFGCADIFDYGKPGKGQLDLQLAAAIQLLDAGLAPQNITLMDVCTYELDEYMYSYRRDKQDAGSMAAFLKLI